MAPRFLTMALALAAVAVLSACGSSSRSSAPSKTTVTLGQAPAGTVSVAWNPATKRITATFDMYGFTPSSSHAVHIHQGGCVNQGPVVVPFPDVSAGPGGAIKTSETSPVAAPNGIPAGSYLNIHLAPSAQLGSPGSLGFTPIACADLPRGATSAATLTMKTPPQAGRHPSGSAQLSYDEASNTLTVSVTAEGLPPSSTHAAHIHLGSCQAQGTVRYPLNPVTAGADGSASVTTVIRDVPSAPPASRWYVNLHMGSPSQIMSNGSPTLLFAPILCDNVAG